MTKKAFQSILLVAGITLLLSIVVIMGCLYEYFGIVQERQLTDVLRLAAAGVEQSGADYFAHLTPGEYRLTWVGADGAVRYDTRKDADQMENHLDRAEIQAALKGGEGIATRYSTTLLEKTAYHATALADGSVLRISVSTATAGVLVMGMLQPAIFVFVGALILSILLARRLARRLIDPLNRLDLEDPLAGDSYEELAPLLTRIHDQHERIETQMRTLKRQADEFTQITDNMREGLALLDERGLVLSMNAAARRLCGAPEDVRGRDFLELDRDAAIDRAIRAARADGHGEASLERGGRAYQIDVSRITSGGATIGVVLLAFDITERASAEQNRREFTANVSHELKTPLQSILGSAELMENGMVKPEDMPRFVGHIRRDAARLVALIDDILRLSQLDEGTAEAPEPVALYALTQDAVDALKDAAAARQVSIHLEGAPVTVQGTPALLYEMVYNLCDNAIKYNVAGGDVAVSVEAAGSSAVVTVADTGVGIPAIHQDRVFERFYRVDKSHSKASGGTGLGLAIVKHVVQCHRGRIALESEPGKGTTIRVTLPATVAP